MELNSNSRVAPVVSGRIGQGHHYISTILPKGSYTLTIRDPFGLDGRYAKVVCSPFSLNSYINGTDDSSSCAKVNYLPTDLYTEAGGSFPYGGPQAADGSIRLYGENFLLSNENGKDHLIRFKVNTTSYMRMFASATAKDDIDFFLFSRNGSTLEHLSVGTDDIESSIIKLEPSPMDYVLDIYTFKIHEEACPTFHFEMAMKTAATIRDELACPRTLPPVEVPPAMISIGASTIISEDYIFTKSRIEANTVGKTFTYAITLRTSANTTLFASVGYDFLANDFRLALLNKDNDKIASSFASGANSRSDYFNFYAMLYAEVVPGTYQLQIIEDVSEKEFDFPQLCHRFSFFLGAFGADVPAIDFVSPPSGSNLDPYVDLELTVTFSVAIATPSSNDLLNYLRTNDAIYLLEDTKKIAPTTASYTSAKTAIKLTFSKNLLAVSKTYKLKVDGSKFRTANGTTFTSLPADPVYSTSTCSCSGHGTCTGGSLICRCDTGYTGSQCELCATGYHAVGTQCVPNVPCTPTTCNNHGNCSDASGTPVCTCYPGYAHDGANLCAACAPGYSGYPNCTRDDSTDRPTRCTAPLLPDDLDNVAFLGYNNEIHLRDEYYIDLDNLKHDMSFSLKKDSLVRIYVEPHWVDVDVWLYKVTDTGSLEFIDFGISIGEEETIYTNLSGGTDKHPTEYVLKFKYFVWNKQRLIDCETFNFELAIAPVDVATAEANRMALQCAATDSLPAPTGATPGSFYSIPGDKPYSYVPNTPFTVRASNNPAKDKANFFYHFDFEVNPPYGKVARISAGLGYRFLYGDLGLLLESGNNQTHCATTGSTAASDSDQVDDCVVGSNDFNTHRLDKTIPAGKYSLWIYEPEPQKILYSKCSLFTFHLHVNYEDAEEDEFYCRASPLPRSLESPGYKDSRGRVHIVDDFLIENRDITFEVTAATAMRVVGKSLVDKVQFQVAAATGNVIFSTGYLLEPSLLVSLLPGQYKLQISSLILSTQECPSIRIELAALPFDDVASNCTSTERLPSPTLTSMVLPYHYGVNGDGSPVSFYAYTNNEVVKTFSFTVDNSVFAEMSISSNFLTHDLVLKLTADSKEIHMGIHEFNRFLIRGTLERGQYVLSIIRPQTLTFSNNRFPPCAEFNFELHFYAPTSIVDTPCLREGEPLPTTFNVIRFLGASDTFLFQSDSIRVPEFSGFYSEKVSFRVTKPSIFRIYTEPHVIDIDLSLFKKGESRPIAAGGFGFNNEETLLVAIEANTDYEIQFLYWKWAQDLPKCNYFNLEVAIAPIAAVALPSLCPYNGGQKSPLAPPVTGLPATRYSYNSEIFLVSDPLYFQQKKTETFVHDMSFTLESSANIHVAVGYNFMNGDLSLKLLNIEDKVTYYGENTFNGNELTKFGLPKGNYRLSIYEPIKNLESGMGCSRYTFQLMIEADQKETMQDPLPTPPRSLDVIPYLSLSDSVYLSRYYTMFSDGKNQEEISFTLKEPSLLRIATTHFNNRLEDIQIVLMANNQIFTATMQDMLELLPADKYSLRFNRPLGEALGTLEVDLELGIYPKSRISSDGDNCIDSQIPAITLSPKGAYTYSNDNLKIGKPTLANSEKIRELPFTLDRTSVLKSAVGFFFPLTDLHLMVIGNSTSNTPVVYHGRNGRNSHELNEVLPPGRYIMQIMQPVTFHYIDSLPHCAVWTLSISIQDESKVNTHVDCGDLHQIPWQLTDSTGGSLPYGGPIDRSGSVHLWGDSFVMPTSSNEVDYMGFNISKDSLVSVVTKSYRGDVTYNLNQMSARMKMIIPPTVTLSSSSQVSSLYAVSPGDRGTTPYEVEFHYKPPVRETCPSFGMQLVMQPKDIVRARTICPPNYNTMARLPFRTISISDSPYSEYLTSIIPYSTLTSQVDSSGNFYHNITITVAKTSNMMLSLSYDSLVSMFQIELLYSGLFFPYTVGRGEAAMTRLSSGSTNINQALSGRLNPGTYYLRITQPKFTSPLVSPTTSATDLCFPFIWDLQIVPDQNVTWVAGVTPAGGYGISPQSPLSIELSFSSKIYDSRGNQITELNVNDVFKTAVYLSSGTTQITPSRAVLDGTRFVEVIFPAESLASSKEYSLNWVTGKVKDGNGRNIIWISTNMYKTIDTTCSGKGVFSEGFCSCSSGYAGDQCQYCDAKYESVSDGSGGFVCKKKTGKLCLEDSCGCSPLVGPGTCLPLGVCDDSSGSIVCKCQKEYAGPTCNICAPGRENYQAGCPLVASCPVCVRGKCDENTKKCVCPDHFTGSTCDECAEGWAGADCSEAVKVPGNNHTISRAAAGIRTISIVLAVIAITATLGFLIYQRFINKNKRYVPVEIDMEHAAELSLFDDDLQDENEDNFDDDDSSSSSNNNRNNEKIRREEDKGTRPLVSLDDDE